MWRETARYPELFMIDARALFPLSIWLLHWAQWTFAMAVVGVGFFVLLSRRGYSPEVFWRYMKNSLVRGNRSIIDPVVYRRRCRF